MRAWIMATAASSVALVMVWSVLHHNAPVPPSPRTTPSEAAQSEAAIVPASTIEGTKREPVGGDGGLPSTAPSWNEFDEHKLRDPDADGIEIVVVDAATRVPCSDALVFAFWEPESRFIGSALTGERPLGAACDAVYRTDVRGVTRIAVHGIANHLLAATASAWGLARVDVNSCSPTTIELHPRRDLVVEVVDAHGAVQPGVALQFGFMREAGARALPFVARFNAWQEATTGADGCASFRGAEWTPSDGRAGSAGVVALLDLRDPPFVPVNIDPLPTDPLRVALPAMGSARIRVVDEKGELIHVDGSARLRATPTDPLVERTGEIELHDGVSAAVRVGLGLELTAIVYLPAQTQLQAARAGPTLPDQQVVVDVPVPNSATYTVGGAVATQDLAPYRGKLELTWLIPTDSPGRFLNAGMSTATDESGGFTADCSRSFFDCGGPELALTGTRPDGAPLWSETFTLSAPASGNVIDLGEQLVLTGPAATIAGRVVDAAGNPVESVFVEGWQIGRRDEPLSPRRDSSRFFVDHPKDGRFQMFVDNDEREVDVTALGRVNGWQSAGHVKCRPGDHDVRIVMTPRGAIAGRVLLDPDLPQESIFASLRSPEWRAIRPPRSFARIELGGQSDFIFEETDAGTVDVVLATATSCEPLVEVRDVLVLPGEVTRDPRLQAIDLRGRLRLLHIDVRAPTGEPTTQGKLRIFDPSDSVNGLGDRALSGSPAVLVVERPIDVLVWAPDCRAEWIRGIDGDRTVRMTPSLKACVTLRFHELPTLRANEELVVQFEPVALPFDRRESHVSELTDPPEVTFTLDDPGDYRIHLLRGAKGIAADFGKHVETTPTFVTVGENDRELTLNIKAAQSSNR